MDLSKLDRRIKATTTKRLGRGVGSGWGKTAGRGNKGAGSRKGKKLPYIGFNGGNIPLARKLPKRGFTSPVAVDIQVVNLESIKARLNTNKEITPADLKRVALIKDDRKPIKILANCKGDFSFAATVSADAFSKKAKELIEKAGGKIQIRTL